MVRAASIGSIYAVIGSLPPWCSAALSVAVWALVMLCGGCNPGASSFERSSLARQHVASLQSEFLEGVAASDRAVMAETDELSTQFARDANRARDATKKAAEELSGTLRELDFAEEQKLLEEFRAEFAAYEVLDRSILALAVENTNVKAMQLSFGAADEAADELKASLVALGKAASAGVAAHVRALTFEAIVAVREIQVLEGPHISEADDGRMTKMEGKMASAEAAARRTLTELSSLLSAPQVAPSIALLDRFAAINREILVLSRRNSNVRSLDLTLGQKRTLVATCDHSLRALSDALTKRVSRATR